MAVDVNSNKYTFIFATVMVVVVASLLALASESLKPMQKANVANEKRQNILNSIGVSVSAAEAQEAYDKYLVDAVVLNGNGEVIDAEVGAFDIDVLKDYKAGLSNIYKANAGDMEAMRSALTSFEENGANYPLFILNKDGEDVYVVPVVGTGLWGPIWGYITIASDGETVVGAIFDHKSETPGLGAEINQPSFQRPFEGKKIFDESGEFTGVKVKKGGADGSSHAVDAISGGTITSNGVSEMIVRTLGIYKPYLRSLQDGGETAETEVTQEVPADSTGAKADTTELSAI